VSAPTDQPSAASAPTSRDRRPPARERLLVIGVALGFALLIVSAAAYAPVKHWWELRDFSDRGLAEIGAPASVCDPAITRPASGAQQHVDAGAVVAYADAPPAFGPHDATPEPMERKFYTAQDRPSVERLVHNLEHGYTLVWYDDSAARDRVQLRQLQQIADKLQGTANARVKVKIVPWTSADGGGFPARRHLAVTHWSLGGGGTHGDQQVGVWQFCSRVSGAALNTFMLAYPYSDSPEPSAP